MALQEFQSDKVLTRTLFNNFGQLLVFVFYAEWNQPSLTLRNNLTTTIPLFGLFDNVKYFAISAEKCPETFKKYSVQYTPTVIFTQTDKKVLKKFETDDVGIIFDSLAEESQAFRYRFQQQKQIWHPKIRSILSESAVIIFIKGTPAAPKCGFTETFIKLLGDHHVQFTYYDILEDEYMRYWLRNYSGWPTYPQLYSQGKLVGGLDVCKQLVAKGQFLPLIPRNSLAAKAEDKLNELLAAHPVIVFTDGFSFESKQTEEFVGKAKALYKDEVAVYNLSLDQSLRQHVLGLAGNTLPLLYDHGKPKQL